MSEVSAKRAVSSLFALGTGLVVPSPRLIGEAGGIDAYGARKLQTAHGARIGATIGQLASVPLLLYAIKSGKLKWRNVDSLKKAALQYVKHVGVPTGLSAGVGAYLWHGGDDPEENTRRALEELKEQLRVGAAVRDAIKDQDKTVPLVKTSALPKLISVMKKVKEQGAPIDPDQEVKLKNLHKSLKQPDENVRREEE